MVKRQRQSFSEKDMNDVVDLRYGVDRTNRVPIRSFLAISRITGLPATSVYNICRRYVDLGFKVENGRKRNGKHGVVLSPQMRAFLLDLDGLRNFGLVKRCKLF